MKCAIICIQAKRKGKDIFSVKNNIEQTFDILACIKRNSEGIYQYYFTIKIPHNLKIGKYGAHIEYTKEIILKARRKNYGRL